MKSKIQKAFVYWRIHGLRKTFTKIKRTICDEGAMALAANNQGFETISTASLKICYKNEPKNGRVNIITDSLGPGSLFGGVATAIIFAALLANKKNVKLRIITRTEAAQPEHVDKLLRLFGIELLNEVQFLFARPSNPNLFLDVAPNDLFLTTSWWTTQSAVKSIPINQLIYLLQEDERMFYPFDYNRLCCEQTMGSENLRIIVNSNLLFEHLKKEGFSNIASQNLWFEPAFPRNIYSPTALGAGKRRFFFYARPSNARSLFELGLEVINLGVLRNILDLNIWDIYFVGKEIPAITLISRYEPIILNNLSWAEYSKFLGGVDLGLCLMYTPHPSYPPLDLAASGAVCVTNQFSNKKDLSCYSENIICANLNTEDLVIAISEGVKLALNEDERKKRYKRNGLNQSWQRALDGVLNQIGGAL